MCGISGIYAYSDKEASVDKELIIRMMNSVKHRGPDGSGIYCNGNIGLGHRRLSIIDLKGGQQPIYNEDRSICIVFNGEIYNYRSLRENLLKKGHRFYTRSDTEVILHLYEELGENFIQELRGMFAIALWDQKKQKLVLARDRLGIKPLFYRIDNGVISFGSEIKCLLQDRHYLREIDLIAFDQYLSLTYIPAPRTIFKGINKLIPGHILVCDPSGIRMNQYWRLKYSPNDDNKLFHVTEELLVLLKESVSLRLMSEVPLGAFLSGGIDSSSVVALMSEVAHQPVNTFSIGYSESSQYFNELPFARMVAKKYGTNHREFIVTPRIENVLDQIICSFDEPFADSSIIPSYYLYKAARRHVTVALSGLGGDELFGGYERYIGILLSQYYQNLPKFFKEKLLPRLISLIPELRNGPPTISRLKRFVNGSMLPPDLRYFAYLSVFSPGEKKKVLNEDIAKELKSDSFENSIPYHFNEIDSNDYLLKATNVDVHTFLPDDILTLTDRLSMLHSLEVRVPMLDHVLVEYAATIPSRLKIRHFKKKYVLQKAMEGRLPKEILQKKKVGFASPVVEWFRGRLKEFTMDVLSEESIRRRHYFNPKSVSKILYDHMTRKNNYQRQILSLLIFEIWHKNYLS